MKKEIKESVPPPDATEYGRKGNLSLGTDLLRWNNNQIDRWLFGGMEPKNALAKLGIPESIAKNLAASDHAFTAGLGKALLLGLGGDIEGAGRKYRELCTTSKRMRGRDRALRAAAAKSSQALSRLIEEKLAAIDILENRTRPSSSMSQLAKKVAKYLKRKPETVRQHLSRRPKSR